jgi:hypothetical protein
MEKKPGKQQVTSSAGVGDLAGKRDLISILPS